jgi:hypothetical protein
MSNFLKKAILSLMVFAAVLLPAASAFAYNPFGKSVCPGGVTDSSAVCKSAGGDPLTTKNGLIWKVTIVIASVAGIVAVIVLVIGGIRFISSNGDAEQIKQAKNTIVYAIIGLAVIVLGQSIIMFVLSRI